MLSVEDYRRSRAKARSACMPGELVNVDFKKLGRIPDGGRDHAGRSGAPKETAAAFWQCAHTFFTHTGLTITAFMTDNGACYRSRDFAAALGLQIKHRRTRGPPCPNQRQGRTVQPHPHHRIGLRPH